MDKPTFMNDKLSLGLGTNNDNEVSLEKLDMEMNVNEVKKLNEFKMEMEANKVMNMEKLNIEKEVNEIQKLEKTLQSVYFKLIYGYMGFYEV